MTARWRILLSVLVLALVAPPPPPAAAQEPGRLDFVNADLRDVIRSLGSLLGLNVLLTEDVPSRRIVFSTARPVATEQLGRVLESILESEGLALIHDGPVARVVAVEDAPAAAPLHFGTELPDPPPLGLITQVVPLRSVQAEEARQVLQQLASPLARIEVMPRSNAVAITDRSTNVARYLELLRSIDVRAEGESGLRTYVYRLRHANAEALAATLGRVFGLQVPTDLQRRPESLEDYSLSGALDAFRNRELEALRMRRDLTPPVAADTTPASRGPAGPAGTTVVPDLATNALIVRTSPPNYPLIRETIDSLDVRPAQVLLEVTVVEVTLDDARRFGIDWAALSGELEPGGEHAVEGRLGDPLRADSLLAGARDFVLRVVELDDLNVRAALALLESESEVRVLSTPHVLTLNNQQARILVGSEVPFNQSTRSGLDVVVDRLVQYRDVGTQLVIVPTINPDGYVTFRMLQQVSALTSQTLEAALNAPVITTREAETTALVRDGATIVIGGLIGDAVTEQETGIPLLKDLPILGYLFKSTETRTERTEIAIFLTPYVVRTDAEAEALLRRERERLRRPPPEPRPPGGAP